MTLRSLRTPMSPQPAVHSLLAITVVLAALPAQEPRTARPTERTVRVVRGIEGERITLGSPVGHALAALPRFGHFVLVVRVVAERAQVELHRSGDGGLTWSRVAISPVPGAGDGALIADGERLFLAVTANGARGFSSVFVQHFDPATGAFVAEPYELAPGLGAEDQYFLPCCERTGGGALCVSVGTHRSPPAPWTGGWNTGLFVLRPDARTADVGWQGPMQLNAGWYGISGDLQVSGDLVYSSHRTSLGDAAIGIRGFDVGSDSFTSATDQRISSVGVPIANTCITCVDEGGGVGVIFVRGATEAGKGALVFAYAARTGKDFTSEDLTDDPPLLAGNENYAHFALTRGPGEAITAVYSKASEGFANLHTRLLVDGKPMREERRIAAGEAGAFQIVHGVRSSQHKTGILALASGGSSAAPHGEVILHGLLPARIVTPRRR